MMRQEQKDEDQRDACWIAGKHEMALMDARNLPGSAESAAATHEAWVQLRKDIFTALTKRATYCDVCGCSCPCCKDKPSLAMIEIAREKCRQYWNERSVGDNEFRAIMGFIHDCLAVNPVSPLTAPDGKAKCEALYRERMERGLEEVKP